MARAPRGLTPDEKVLWEKVQNNTTPIRPNVEQTVMAAVTKLDRPEKTFAIPHFEIGANVIAGPSRQSMQIGAPLPPANSKASRRLKNGIQRPDATIDLHGMTQDQAHPALIGFVMRAHQRGHRLILVITGKGQDRKKPNVFPAQVGVLKRQVPHWLELPPAVSVIRNISQAPQSKGGEGAIYIHLRRQKT